MFAEYCTFDRALLQKRRMFLGSLKTFLYTWTFCGYAAEIHMKVHVYKNVFRLPKNMGLFRKRALSKVH